MRALGLWVSIIAVTGVARAEDKPINLSTSLPTTIAVSSTVDNAAIKPEHIADGKLDTAWNSLTGDLAPHVMIRVPATAKVTSIKLTAGFTKVDKKLGDLFTMNPRIKKVRVSSRTIAKDFDLDIANRGLQELKIDLPGGDIDIAVVASEPGTKKTWREISISELQVWGTTTKPAAKLQKPIVRVGSFEPPAVLTRAECLKVMFPKAKGNRVGPEAEDEKIVGFSALALGGDIDICRFEHADDVTTTAEIAAVRRTPRLAVIQRIDTLHTSSEVIDKDMGAGKESTVDLEAFPLTTTETGLLVHESDRTFGPMQDDGHTDSTLYRVTTAGMVPILTYKSTWSGGESDDADRCTLQPPTLGTNLPALQMECVKSEGRWHGEDPRGNGTFTEERMVKFRWKGNAYEER